MSNKLWLCLVIVYFTLSFIYLLAWIMPWVPIRPDTTGLPRKIMTRAWERLSVTESSTRRRGVG